MNLTFDESPKLAGIDVKVREMEIELSGDDLGRLNYHAFGDRLRNTNFFETVLWKRFPRGIVFNVRPVPHKTLEQALWCFKELLYIQMTDD